MNALVVGGGSIARRHTANLASSGEIDKIFVYTQVPGFLESLDNSSGKVSVSKSLRNVDADIALICNETYLHVDTAIALASEGKHLFIEKPLSHDLNNLDNLKELVRSRKLKVFLGYNLRSLGALTFVKDQIDRNVLGKLQFARFEVGQYLPSWRPDQDYRKCYSSFRAKGGGVGLDLSHEIDCMRFLFDDPLSWKTISTKVSPLEIDSDDVFEGIYLYRDFVCSIHLDYLQKQKRRELRLEGSDGALTCDLVNKNVSIFDGKTTRIMKDEQLFDVNRTYRAELVRFLESIDHDSEPDITIDDGIRVLELIKDGHV